MPSYVEITDGEIDPESPLTASLFTKIRDNPIALNENLIGSIVMHAANSTPPRTLHCNGASLNTTTFADLFAVIGYTFGGSGSNFNVPDLRGQFVRGWDAGRGVDTGRSFGSDQVGAFFAHTHGAGSYATTDGTINDIGAGTRPFATQNGASSIDAVVSGTSASAGGIENRPRNTALMFSIIYEGAQ